MKTLVFQFFGFLYVNLSVYTFTS